MDGVLALTRRHALLLGAASLLARTGVARASAAPLRRSAFARLVGRRFRVDGTRAEVRLTEVSGIARRDQRGRAVASREDAFALYFRGAELTEGLHRFTHPAVGSVSLYVVPTGRRRREYQAIVNRLR